MARPEIEPKTELGRRLRESRKAVGFADRPEFSERLGLPLSTIAAYERGDREPSASALVPYLDEFGISIEWLLTGRGAMLAGPRVATDIERMQDHWPDHQVIVPRFDVRAAAGSGALVLTENVSSYFTVDREWLRRALPSWAGSNAVVGILDGAGDSMEPTIRDGDLVMAVQDPPASAIDRGGVFVVLHHDHLRIKRLQIEMRSGDISLISDNPRYAVETVPFNRIEFDLHVLAQVFFAGGRLRSI